MLWLASLMVVRNHRTLAAFQARQQHQTRVASDQQPHARKRRRELADTAAGPP